MLQMLVMLGVAICAGSAAADEAVIHRLSWMTQAEFDRLPYLVKRYDIETSQIPYDLPKPVT
jgi:hypothetical protein